MINVYVKNKVWTANELAGYCTNLNLNKVHEKHVLEWKGTEKQIMKVTEAEHEALS